MSATPTLEIPFAATCAEHGDAPNPRRCPRCARIAASQRTQRSVSASLFTEWDRRRDRRPDPPLESIADFQKWMIKRLEQVDGLAAAKICWKAARALLVVDASYAESLIGDVPGFEEPDWLDTTQELRQRVPEVPNRMIVQVPRSHNSRIQLARDILGIGIELSRNSSSGLYVELAGIEWAFGKLRMVPDHLERAIAVARTLREKSQAIGNYAVYEMDAGNVGNALRLNRVAIMTSPNRYFLLLNEAIWRSTCDHKSVARDAVRRFVESSRVSARSLAPSMETLARWIRNTALRVGVDFRLASTRTREVARCLVNYR